MDPHPDQPLDPQSIAERYLELLQAGNAPSREEFLRAHPDPSGALSKRLALLQVMHRAALGSSLGSHVRSVLDQSALKIRCPHCGQVSERNPDSKPGGIAGDASRAHRGGEVICTACGRPFIIDLGAPTGGRLGDLPAQIGKFHVLSLLGRGSFGAVYKAQDPELGRLVAIKMPRISQLFSPEEEERFLREARSAALLHHPGIVQVYEVDEERGLPYIVSEYIEGRNLAEFLAAGTPAYRETAETTARIAEALHFAHEAKITHRDIKPGNILLDSAGRPHIADFGLARHDEDKVTVTVEGQVIGTPAYMSPEQAAGDSRNVGARSDIYSVGVVLYELLTGERPFRGSRTQLIHQVLHDEPRPPSTLNDRIPRDLETICLKAMSKEPGRRYGTAADMAADLRRFLEGRPILARPVSRPERLWRWSRRNPVVASLVSAVGLLLIAIAAVSTVMALRTALAWNEANQRLARLHVATGFRLAGERDLLGSLPWFAEAHKLDAGRPSRDTLHRLRFECSLMNCPKLLRVWSYEHIYYNRIRTWFHPGGESILIVSGGRSRIAGLDEDGRADLQLPPADVIGGSFHPDGRLAITYGKDGAVRFWDAASGAPEGQPLRHQGPINHASFTRDGRFLVTSGDDKTVRIWRMDSGEAVGAPLMHGGAVRSASFDATGGRVVTACADGSASVWDVASSSRIGERMAHGGPIDEAVFSPDGLKVATASSDQSAGVWDSGTGMGLIPRLQHANAVVGVTFSRDGLRLLTASYDGTAVVWDVGSGAKLLTLSHRLGVPTASFSPDERRILTASFDGTACVWNAATGARVSPPLHNGGALHGASFSPEGRRVLTASNDDTLRLWDLATGGRHPAPLHLRGWISHTSFSPDGTRVLVATSGGILQVCDAKNITPAGSGMTHGTGVTHAAFSSDGRSVVSSCADGTVLVWDVRTLRVLGKPFTHPRSVRRSIFSPDSRRIATACEDGGVRLWDIGSGDPIGSGMRHPGVVNDVSFMLDGRRLLSACADGAARIWDLEKGEIAVVPMQHANAVMQASLSPDGTRVATASKDQTGRVWDASTGAPVTTPFRHDSALNSIEFSHDGRRVVTTSYDATGRVWDARTGMPITPPLRHRGVVGYAAFSPDDALVATASSDETAIVWDAETGEQVTPPFLHRSGVARAIFSPDGKQLLTASADGVAALWSLPSSSRPLEDEGLLSHMLSGRRIDSTGGFVRIPTRDFEDAWRNLRGKYRVDFTPSPEEILAWHDHEAEECEAARDWTAVLVHLAEILRRRPGDLHDHLRRGRAHGWLGRLEEASADYAAAIDLGSSAADIFHVRALARLGIGDLNGFRRSSEEMFSRFREADDAATANELAWNSTIVPGTFQDLSIQVAAAERAVTAAPRSANYRNTLGAVLFRAGHYDRALRELEESVKLQGAGGTVLDWLFLAMVHHRLGQSAFAATFLDRARTWAARLSQQSPQNPMMSNWSDSIEVRALLDEAEALLAGR